MLSLGSASWLLRRPQGERKRRDPLGGAGGARVGPSHPASQGAPRPGSRGAAAPCALARLWRASARICGSGLPRVDPVFLEPRSGVQQSMSR